ncbi:hypothetical protein [Acinetobacter phage HFM1]|nr:hypothetical protein [Acinetobacter phage HFM1]
MIRVIYKFHCHQQTLVDFFIYNARKNHGIICYITEKEVHNMACFEPWTLDEVKQKLENWLAAEDALATSKSYTIDGRTLTRANMQEIASRIAYWKNEAERLSCGRKSVNRVMRFVPRDL